MVLMGNHLLYTEYCKSDQEAQLAYHWICFNVQLQCIQVLTKERYYAITVYSMYLNYIQLSH